MALFKKSAPNHQQGITGLTKPAPMPAAAQRAQSAGGFSWKSAVLVPALAFVAVGSLAFIALQKFSAPEQQAVTVYSSAPPSGLASQVMNAIKVPHDQELEAARQALLNDDVGPMEIKPLDDVVALTQPDRVFIEETPRVADPLPVRDVELVTAQTPDPIEPEPIVVAAVEPEVIAPAVPQPVVEAVDCFEEVRVLSSASTIFFASGSAVIDGDAMQILKTIGQKVEDCPSVLMHVTGHSDSVGSEQGNMSMSWKRADQVVASLNGLGVDTSRFDPVGFGARSPLSQGDSGDDELNRRVEFHPLRKHSENP